VDLNTVEDFTCGFLHFAELVHVVPELGFGNGRVWGEDNHAVGLWVWVFSGGGFTAYHLVLIHLSCDSHLIFFMYVGVLGERRFGNEYFFVRNEDMKVVRLYNAEALTP
jgi:hypothetical protein